MASEQSKKFLDFFSMNAANREKVDRIVVKAQSQKVFVEVAARNWKAMEELERIYDSRAAVWQVRERKQVSDVRVVVGDIMDSMITSVELRALAQDIPIAASWKKDELTLSKEVSSGGSFDAVMQRQIRTSLTWIERAAVIWLALHPSIFDACYDKYKKWRKVGQVVDVSYRAIQNWLNVQDQRCVGNIPKWLPIVEKFCWADIKKFFKAS